MATQSFVRVPPDSTGKLVDAFLTSGNAHYRQAIVIADPDVDGQFVSISSTGKLPVQGEYQLDYDTTTIATANVTVFGIALPSATGAVAGGTSTSPLNITGVLTAGTLTNVTVSTCALPAGAATSAIQTAQLAVLQTTGIVVTTNAYAAGMASSTNQTDVIGTKAAGVAATKSLLGGAVYNSTPLTVTDGQQASLQSDANGYLKVVTVGASGGTSAVDKTGFTTGTTSLTPVGGIFDDTTTSTLTEDQVGVFRATQYRALHVNLRDTTGGYISTLPVSIATGINATVTNAVLTSWDETARAKVNPIVGQVGVAANTGTISASTQRVMIATDDNVSTKLTTLAGAITSARMQSDLIVGSAGIAASTGNVSTSTVRVAFATNAADISAIIPGTGDTQLGKAEDATHTSGATGVMVLGIRQDTQTSLVSTTGDYAGLTSDKNGGLYVRPSYGPVISERVSTTIGTSTAFSNFTAVSNIKNYVTAITVYRTDAGTGQEYVDIRSGTAGTVLWTMPLPPSGGACINGGSNPLFASAANTALAYDVSANLTSVIISMSGYQDT